MTCWRRSVIDDEFSIKRVQHSCVVGQFSRLFFAFKIQRLPRAGDMAVGARTPSVFSRTATRSARCLTAPVFHSWRCCYGVDAKLKRNVWTDPWWFYDCSCKWNNKICYISSEITYQHWNLKNNRFPTIFFVSWNVNNFPMDAIIPYIYTFQPCGSIQIQSVQFEK